MIKHTPNIRYISFIILLGLSCEDPDDDFFKNMKGKHMQPFEMLDTKKNIRMINKIKNDSSTVLFFFSPDCPHCNDVIKEMIASKSFNQKAQFVFIAYPPARDVKSFIREYNLDKWNNITIGFDYKDSAFIKYKIKNIPSVVCYDSLNRMNYYHSGEFDVTDLNKEI